MLNRRFGKEERVSSRDGIFPPLIKSIRGLSKLVFDVHLMVSNPDYLLDEYIAAGII